MTSQNRPARIFRSAVLVAATVALFMPAAVSAHDIEVSGLIISHPWARATAPRAQSGGVFMTIDNHGDQMERLLGFSTPIAGRGGIHNTTNDNGVMRMRPVDAIDVPSQGQAKLAPGGFHIMLVGLEERLAEGTRFPLTLHFENAGDIEVEVAVQGAGSATPDEVAAHGHDAATPGPANR